MEVDGFPNEKNAKENVPVRGKLCEVRLKS